MIPRTLLLCIALISVFLFSCPCDDKPTPPEPEPDVIISDDTYIVEEGGPVTLESIDSTIFTFSYEGATPDIEAGYIIVGREQGGYFRKALSVAHEESGLIVETGDAALVEAIQKGHFSIIDTLDWSSLSRNGRGKGRGRMRPAHGVEAQENGTIEFSDLEIFSDDYLNITIAEGSIGFTPIIDIDGRIDFPSILREFHALATGTIDVYADFQAISSRDYTITHETAIPGCEWEFGPYWVLIGVPPLAWPLEYSFVLSIIAGFEYSSDSPLVTQDGFRNYASLTVGARYEDGDWESVFEPTFDLSAREVIWDKSGDIVLKGYIKPTITMKLYTYPGPYLDAGPYLEFDGALNYPQWQYELNAGLESSLGIKVKFFSFELLDFNTVLFGDELTIASNSGTLDNSPPNQPSNPQPPDGAVDQSIDVDLSWSCSDPDNDPLTYDVYFGTDSIPPLISEGQTETTYDPGTLSENTEYYWRIVAHDGYGQAEGQVWRFVTINGGQGTEVEGDISGTWTPANSPYFVVGELRVAPGSTLSIEPGCYIDFRGHYKLIVDTSATLVAIGTETDSIVFTTADTSNGWHGIRFYSVSGSSQLSYCRIEYGNATGSGEDGYGGAVYCNNSSPTISHNTISNNSAGKGGGICCEYSSPAIRGNTISNNLASDGGGILCDYSSPAISGNIITGNSAIFGISRKGGGILCGNNSNPPISNNTISNNSASHYGGGIYCNSSSPTVMNTILWGDTAPNGSEIYVYSGNPIVTYCDVQGGWEGEGNIDVAPLFRDPGSDNFHLMADYCGDPYNSPCIDAGDPTILDDFIDCEWGLGNDRSDMGAYGGLSRQ